MGAVDGAAGALPGSEAVRRAVRRVLALIRRDRLERDLDDEIRVHLELAERDALAAGLSPDEARAAARRSFGGIDQMKEEHRDQRSARWVEDLLRDVRYGMRTMRRTPALCAAIVLILGISIGANTTMFSAIQAILLRPLAYGNPDELVVVLHGGRFPVSPANFRDWREQTRSFAAMGAAEYWQPNVGLATGAERLLGLRVTPGMLSLLQVPPLYGRLFEAADSDASADHRVVISYGLWQRSFSGDPGAIGRDLRLDGEPYTVIGIMPADFEFAPFWAVGAELWAPLPLAGRTDNRGASSLRVFARLEPGISIAQAQANVDAITSKLEALYPGTNRDVRVVPLRERVVGDTRPALIVFMAGVGFVLLIACANVAHMLLARAASRRHEVAVRLALGATRGQIIRQVLVESLLLALASGLAGLAIAASGIRLLVLIAPTDLPRVTGINLDGAALAFATAVSLGTGLVFGLCPALQAAGPAVGVTLKNGRGTTADRRQGRLRDLLIASEIALALVLLAGAGLMVRSMAALQSIDPGFDPRGVLAAAVSVQGTPHGTPPLRAPFFTELLGRLRSLPAVQSASAINHLPIHGDIWTRGFMVEGRPEARPGEGPNAAYRVVLPGYFETMGLRLVRGRDFSNSDSRDAPGVVILSENLGRRHWPGEDPIGKRIALGRSEAGGRDWLTVIGLVQDAVRDSWNASAGDEIYLPYLQTIPYLDNPESRYTYLTVVIKARGEPASLAAPLRNTVATLDRGASVSDITTMEDAIARALAGPRFQLTLLGLFAGVALLLAAAGIYSVMSYAVSRRTREIGVRLALGAQRSDVLRMVLRQVLMHVAFGTVAGLMGASLLTRLMSSLLYEVQPGDPVTFALVSGILAGVALLAGYVPARRASRIDPLGALRD